MDEQTTAELGSSAPDEGSPSAEPLTKEGLMAVLADGKIVVVDGRSAYDEAGVDFILSCYASKPEAEAPKLEAPSEPVKTEEAEETATTTEEAAPVADKTKGK